MKRYKAIASGAWSDLTTWQDDGNGSFQASTVLPSSDDEVYCNGFVIDVVSGTYQVALISNGESSNQDNEPVNVGGNLRMANDSNKTCYFIADCYNYSTHFLQADMVGNRSHIISITGNCYNYSGIFITTSSGVNTRRCTLSITGNVVSQGSYLLDISGTGSVTSNSGVTINGNVNANSTAFYNANGSVGYIAINGNVVKNGGIFGTTNNGRSINGSLHLTANSTQSIEVNNGEIINAFWLSAGHTGNVTKYRIILDNQEWFLPSDITNGLPQASDVRQGTTFGLNNVFTGTLDLPQPANVVKDVSYDNNTKTGTYAVSISPQDISDALTAYGAAKASDLSGLSTLKLADIATALANYGAAKGSQLNGLSTLTSNDIAAALATYAVAKASDLSGLSTLKLADIATALANYGAAKGSDLNGMSTLTSNDIATALANYGTCKTSDLSSISISTEDILTALTAYGTAKDSDIYAIAQLLQALKNSQVSREFLIHLLGE